MALQCTYAHYGRVGAIPT